LLWAVISTNVFKFQIDTIYYFASIIKNRLSIINAMVLGKVCRTFSIVEIKMLTKNNPFPVGESYY
jgi:hypothetical protein